MRFIASLTACLIATTASAAILVPSGLAPGDHYQLMFATSFTTYIDTDTSLPPSIPFFGGLAGGDYTVTFAAYQAGMLPNWNGSGAAASQSTAVPEPAPIALGLVGAAILICVSERRSHVVASLRDANGRAPLVSG